MFSLIKNIEIYAPVYCGKKNILIAGGEIYKIMPPGEPAGPGFWESETDCSGLYAFPGVIDQHVHILGAGGEEGFVSRVPELMIGEIVQAGVTTLVGLLGADDCSRSMEGLYAKAKALDQQGLTTFIYSGSYAVPPVTLTGSIKKDLVLIDKVIGAGEIAISDHRSTQPDCRELMKLAADVHLGGLLSGKAGVVHLHVGDGKGGLSLLQEVLRNSDLPMEQFVPTHVNRNPVLFENALQYCRQGGNIDLTAGESAGIGVPQAVRRLVDEKTDLSRVTVSSDSNGSIPGGGVSKISALLDDIRKCILEFGIGPETAWALVSENVAKILKLFPQKGVIREGSDADIVVADKNCQVKMLMAQGKVLFTDGQI